MLRSNISTRAPIASWWSTVVTHGLNCPQLGHVVSPPSRDRVTADRDRMIPVNTAICVALTRSISGTNTASQCLKSRTESPSSDTLQTLLHDGFRGQIRRYVLLSPVGRLLTRSKIINQSTPLHLNRTKAGSHIWSTYSDVHHRIQKNPNSKADVNSHPRPLWLLRTLILQRPTRDLSYIPISPRVDSPEANQACVPVNIMRGE